MKEFNQNTENFLKQYKDLHSWADRLKINLTEEKFNHKPASGGWSVGECIEHLNQVAEMYLPQIKDAITKAEKKELFSNKEFKPRFIQKKMIDSLEPPYKMKMKTFKSMKPSSSLSMEEVLGRFNKLNNDFIGLIEESDKLDYGSVVVTSPVSSLIKFKLGEAYLFLAVHTRRHLWQAEQVLK
ncbi:MAG: DinB family protein [Ignavibacteriae bacterium]|nr:DinB family protein [Ignavibacteriota bacterium]NOG98112.1 DinB family protein [Ignavibacteriota bacterium]